MSSLPPFKILSRWETTFPMGMTSPLEFYRLVEEALLQQLPGLKLSLVSRPEGGIFSSRRWYLRIREDKLFFDLCAMPLGQDFQVSWWLCLAPPDAWDLLCEIPVIGNLLRQFFTPVTWFEIDRKAHFQHCVHKTVQAVLDELASSAPEWAEPESSFPPQLMEYDHEHLD